MGGGRRRRESVGTVKQAVKNHEWQAAWGSIIGVSSLIFPTRHVRIQIPAPYRTTLSVLPHLHAGSLALLLLQFLRGFSFHMFTVDLFHVYSPSRNGGQPLQEEMLPLILSSMLEN
ncbi:hypothetical protein V6N11_022877 [Hibiscus sabdariffa]|uniref:Uncharacterized protein n=1 Tax=Hibiscus sabdariffa TaxID=183260 RepID=A0ABR2TKG9_9ROSI